MDMTIKHDDHRMSDEKARVLIVEDQLLIAIDMQESVAESAINAEVIGFAGATEHALKLGFFADVAFVDVNLSDGPTGPEIGRQLAEQGVAVIFMTANPEALGTGVPGTLGVLTKPVSPDSVRAALAYSIARHRNKLAIVPKMMRSFHAQ